MDAATISILENAMTVAELREELANMDDDARVVFACDYGDHGHTEQALLVRSVEQLYDDTAKICETAYSNSGICIQDIDADEDEDEDAEDADDQDEDAESCEVVILRA
jgi:regulator of RNase E activity RraB